MKTPDVWQRLGKAVHQDFLVDYPDFWSGIVEFSMKLSESERSDLAEYLRYLSESDLPGGTVKRSLSNMDASIWITPRGNQTYAETCKLLLACVEDGAKNLRKDRVHAT